MTDGTLAGRVGHCGGCAIVPRGGEPTGTQVPCVQRPPTTSSTSWGGGVIPKLLSFVDRAMDIAQLTHLRISIPASGAPPGKVPADCFPSAVTSADTIAPRRVSFAPDVPMSMEDTQLNKLADTDVSPDDRSVTTTDAKTRPVTPPETLVKTVSPPPGFPQFLWPQEDWMLSGDPSLDPGLQFVTSWSGSYRRGPPNCPPPCRSRL